MHAPHPKPKSFGLGRLELRPLVCLTGVALFLVGCSDAPPAPEPEPAAPAATPAAPIEPIVLPADDTAALAANEGREIAVEGTVVRIGSTPNGDLTFLNFTPQRGGFTAVIHRSNYDSFPDGFGAYNGRSLRVTGKLEIYQGETPQIRVSAPAQLTNIEPRPTP
jgi:hypothetical protein